MRIGNIDLDKEVLVIAEIGNNHEGNFALAEEMIGLAARAGAQAVKFQTIVPEKLVSAKETERIARFKRFQFSYEQFAQLKKVADRENVMFLSTPFDIESAQFLNSIVPAFKIASGDLTFFPMIETIARTGKPIIFSTGAGTLDEIKKTRDFIRHIWADCGFSPAELGILHCVCSYPTPPEQANLGALADLAKLDVVVGYSDHTVGNDASLYAVSAGARIIEKHFTIDKNYSDFRDHQVSMDSKDLKELMEKIKEISSMFGRGGKSVQDCEAANLTAVRRSIVASRELNKGTKLALTDLTWVRPADGLAPGREGELIGRTLKKGIAAGEPILLADIDS